MGECEESWVSVRETGDGCGESWVSVRERWVNVGRVGKVWGEVCVGGGE